MNFSEWIANAFKRPQINRETGEIVLCEASRQLEERISYKTLALNACIDFVANALISCEFQIFDQGSLAEMKSTTNLTLSLTSWKMHQNSGVKR